MLQKLDYQRNERYTKKLKIIAVLHMFTLILFLFNVHANCRYCDSLHSSDLHVLSAVKNNFIINQCAHTSLGISLRKIFQCPIASRLSQFACFLLYKGDGYDVIMEKLTKRYQSMTSTKKYEINYSMFEWAGDSSAPVTIAVYISIGCPWCKLVCNFLHDSVTTGSLNGKAKVCVKLLSAHHYNMALLAADKSGKFWEYMKALGKVEQRIDEQILADIAQKVSIPIWRFKVDMNNQKLQEKMVLSRKEGLENNLRVTPTIFINGRLYTSDKSPEWIVDAVKYEYSFY